MHILEAIFLFSLRIAYFMAMALTSVSFIQEKKEGLYARSFVAGEPYACLKYSIVTIWCFLAIDEKKWNNT